MGPTILCIASYYKGDRFLERSKQEGCRVVLLTSEQFLHDPWPRHAIDEVFALPNFVRDLVTPARLKQPTRGRRLGVVRAAVK